MTKSDMIKMRSSLFNEHLKKDSSQELKGKTLNRLASIPEEQREAEAERIIQMMNTISEKEVLENL